jgi:hypothetical protein
MSSDIPLLPLLAYAGTTLPLNLDTVLVLINFVPATRLGHYTFSYTIHKFKELRLQNNHTCTSVNINVTFALCVGSEEGPVRSKYAKIFAFTV